MTAIEQKICAIIDAKKDEIIAFGRDIWEHAEIGFQEVRTAQKFADAMRALDLPVRENIAVTGVKATLEGEGRKVSLLGELDALMIDGHPSASPTTGASHACGHHAQPTAILGAAFALTDPEVRAAMHGSIDFCGVPCEEGITDAVRDEMLAKGLIKYTSGKGEWLRLGELDDADIVIGCHAASMNGMLIVNSSCNGFITKRVVFTGKATHAGNAAHLGVNAQAAANIAQFSLDAMRETFNESDCIRVHSCVMSTNGTTSTITDRVEMKYSIRAKNAEAITVTGEKVDRCIRAAAMATGCGAVIDTDVGYLPWVPLPDASFPVACANDVADGKYPVILQQVHIGASSDIGDVSQLKPVMEIFSGGFAGDAHSPEFCVVDEALGYVELAKVLAITTYRLLCDDAKQANAMVDAFDPPMTREAYFHYKDSNISTEEIAFTGVPTAEK